MKKVSVLLSVYNPNENYLIKQLKSLDNQTYQNMEILIYDDCPNNRCNKDIFRENLKNKEYKLLKYCNNNVGYSLAFGKLVESVNHDGYVAFCDQDDIWLENKIEVMVNELEKQNKNLAYCDRIIIDENDQTIKNYEVNELIADFKDDYHKLLIGSPFRTLAPGMSIICLADFAKKCINKFDEFAFDKWLSCCALAEDSVIHISKPLVKYRRHSNNVTGALNGINSKEDYYNQRILSHHKVVLELHKKYPNVDLKEQINYSYARVKKNIVKLFKYGWINKRNNKLEILMFLTPNFIFKKIIKKI